MLEEGFQIVNLVIKFRILAEFNFQNIFGPLKDVPGVYDVKLTKLNSEKVLQFKYKNITVRIFKSGYVLCLFSKPKNLDVYDDVKYIKRAILNAIHNQKV